MKFQNNTNFNHGPFGHVQNILNIQPVVPVGITSDWNIVTRTILPVVSQPTFQTGEGTIFGLGRPSSLPSCRPGSPAR